MHFTRRVARRHAELESWLSVGSSPAEVKYPEMTGLAFRTDHNWSGRRSHWRRRDRWRFGGSGRVGDCSRRLGCRGCRLGRGIRIGGPEMPAASGARPELVGLPGASGDRVAHLHRCAAPLTPDPEFCITHGAILARKVRRRRERPFQSCACHNLPPSFSPRAPRAGWVAPRRFCRSGLVVRPSSGTSSHRCVGPDFRTSSSSPRRTPRRSRTRRGARRRVSPRSATRTPRADSCRRS